MTFFKKKKGAGSDFGRELSEASESVKAAEARLAQAKLDIDNIEEAEQRAAFAVGEAEATLDAARNRYDDSGSLEDRKAGVL